MCTLDIDLSLREQSVEFETTQLQDQVQMIAQCQCSGAQRLEMTEFEQIQISQSEQVENVQWPMDEINFFVPKTDIINFRQVGPSQ